MKEGGRGNCVESRNSILRLQEKGLSFLRVRRSFRGATDISVWRCEQGAFEGGGEEVPLGGSSCKEHSHCLAYS